VDFGDVFELLPQVSMGKSTRELILDAVKRFTGSRFDSEAGTAHLAGLGLAMLSVFSLTRVLGSGFAQRAPLGIGTGATGVQPALDPFHFFSVRSQPATGSK
jgi:hypothetical protein